MEITMIGIDHSKASVSYRELFSFTKTQALEAMKQIKKKFHLNGCLLLSTCNRTELWISGNNHLGISPYDMLCEIKQIDKEKYERYFVERKGEEAVDHLFQMSCGLTSRLFGEDQIISQVREALVATRECGCGDVVIEKLFQSAIAAAKKVKSTVRLTVADQSTATSAVALLKRRLGNLSGIPCLVIGNGQMGKLIASALVSCGGKVFMTLRKRVHGREEQDSIVPEGCEMVPYEGRISLLSEVRVVISATLSPHYTIARGDLERILPPEDAIWMDLAVPRDIDPEIARTLPITVCDIDELGDEAQSKTNEYSVKRALEILEEHARELERWFAFREEVPQVKKITELAAEDVQERLAAYVKDFNIDKKRKEELEEAVYSSAEKSVGKILYGLRQTLPLELWEVCINALETAAQRDTLKTGRKI